MLCLSCFVEFAQQNLSACPALAKLVCALVCSAVHVYTSVILERLESVWPFSNRVGSPLLLLSM